MHSADHHLTASHRIAMLHSPTISLRGSSLFLLFIVSCGNILMAQQRPIVIAHRGASGYLPEHTLAAKAFAYACGTDYLEQDIVLTSDDVPIVVHDRVIDTVTNVAEVFPDRCRDDGRYYAIDFTWAELAGLRVTERVEPATCLARYPDRFPAWQSRFTLHTLADELELIAGLNQSTGHNIGIYPEIKSPAWHREEGKDISTIVLAVLADHGYTEHEDRCYLQCFEADEVQRIRGELGCRLKLVQLMLADEWGDRPLDAGVIESDLQAIAEYADGIGPAMSLVVAAGASGEAVVTPLVSRAHAVGLEVHPWTLRADELPPFADDFDEACRILFEHAHVDGAFSDFPDRTLRVLK